ncbi:MAG: Ppx/GppA family phosphatase [Proteobacteria bacterium]|nr:Ppx/GppA family phosphatase [Pseudomonadota bacterium]
MKRASIDIGTNTVRLLIAEVADGSIKPLLIKRAITRLGGGYSEKHGISPEARERTIKVLEEFASVINAESVASATVSATSVMRRAVNSDAIISEVKSRTGLEIEVITGETEARLSMLGVLSVFSEPGPIGKSLTIDIGGGSTEFIASTSTSTSNEIKGLWSLELGVVHLSEEFLKSDPPTKSELSAMEAEIEGVFGVLKASMKADGVDPESYSTDSGALFIGTAGTITTLAAVELDLEEYDPEKVNNYQLSVESVTEIFARLKRIKIAERKRIAAIEKGREDLIVAGTAVALGAMRAFGFDSMVVSDAGLLEGLLLG